MISTDDIKFYSFIAIFVIVVAGGVYLYFGGSKNFTQPKQEVKTTQSQPAQGNQPGTVASAPTGSSVTIKNFAFSPSVLRIKAGDTVTWTNQDSIPHSIKSTIFNSSPFNQGNSVSFKFEQKGAYDYTCGIHPAMTGQIVVE